MLRLTGILLVLAVLVAPFALATPTPETTVEEPAAPALLQKAGSALATGATKAAEGAKAAGNGIADLAGAIGGGIAAAAKAIGTGIASAASAIGAGIAVAAKAIGTGIVALFGLLGAGLAAAGRGIASAAGAAASFLGMLLGKGASTVRAHPVPAAATAGSAAGLGLLAWLLKRLGGLGFLATLYTRLRPDSLLENEARHAVYEHVRSHPGAHPSAIAETLHLGWGTVVYHLAKLEGSKLVTSRLAHNRKCYFALTADLDGQARTAIAAMGTDKTRSIVEAVRASPGISQKELSERLGMSQALASWHVKRLIESGVLTAERAGRSNALRVAAHVPAGIVPVAA